MENTLIHVTKYIKKVETGFGLTINDFLNKFGSALCFLIMLFHIDFDQEFQPVLEKTHWVKFLRRAGNLKFLQNRLKIVKMSGPV